MKKKPDISFRTFGGSGPLSIYWFPGPYGDAIEALKGDGVAWLSPSGDLLGVEFDDVDENSDHQIITTPGGYSVEVSVKNKKVDVDLKKSNRVA